MVIKAIAKKLIVMLYLHNTPVFYMNIIVNHPCSHEIFKKSHYIEWNLCNIISWTTERR